MEEKKDLFEIARKVAPFATIASLCIVSTTFCIGKCNNAINALIGSATLFLICVVSGSFFLLTDDNFWKMIFYGILSVCFLLAIILLFGATYQIYQATHPS